MRKLGVLAVPLAVTAATYIGVGACTTTETGRKQFNFVPESQMNALGAQAYGEMLQKEKISTNTELAAKVADIGHRIAKASGRDFEWEFTLFDSKDVNAFCLPGGKVGVYTGIIPVAKTNAALAAVMGHEVAHAVLRHSAERVSQQLAISGGLVALDAILSGSGGDPQTKQLIMGAIGLGAQFGVMLPYSRKHEAEADEVGLTYMAKAGFEPSEAVELWKRMEQASGGSPPEILSTHPNPDTRIKALAARIPSVQPLYDQSQKVPTVTMQ